MINIKHGERNSTRFFFYSKGPLVLEGKYLGWCDLLTEGLSKLPAAGEGSLTVETCETVAASSISSPRWITTVPKTPVFSTRLENHVKIKNNENYTFQTLKLKNFRKME